MRTLESMHYNVQKFQRSNQDTCLIQRPSVFEGEWVQPGDLLADCSASKGGELSLGQNILIAYMPWEGYNYEDAILISQRLVSEDLYTSIHIEKYEVDTHMTKYGYEEITRNIPDVPSHALTQLDETGIIQVGASVMEGQILVGKVTPIEKKFKSPYQKLLYTILEKELAAVRDSSLRAPKGLKAKVIERKIFEKMALSFEGKKQKMVHLYLAEKRRIQVGDKMAGRHGNKGIVSQILPREDMPYLPDGSPIDMILNPLGVPSRMNVGQIYECLLGLAAKYLGQSFRIRPFDEIYGAEASRTLTFSSLYKARLKTGHKWLFNPKSPGKMKIYDGRTGTSFHQTVTVGISYILKLVHLVDDKVHCLTPDHDVLTTDGWVPVDKITIFHKVATLEPLTGQLVYQSPSKIFTYPNYNGSLYHIQNSNMDLLVTPNHRMFVKPGNNRSNTFADYKLLEAKDLIGKHVQYLKNAQWNKKNYQFSLPSIISNSLDVPELQVNMDDWLTFFGLWVSKGCENTYLSNQTIEKSNNLLNKQANFSQGLPGQDTMSVSKMTISKELYQVQLISCKQDIHDILTKAVTSLGYSFKVMDHKMTIHNKQLWTYLCSLSIGATNKVLPSWVWELSQSQADKLLSSLCLGNDNDASHENFMIYDTSSTTLADDVMRLALHAGWSGNQSLRLPKNRETLEGRKTSSNEDVWRISIMKKENKPSVNQGQDSKQTSQTEEILTSYQGGVYCFSVPNEVFYVRRNGLPVWTGNSRSTGPYSLVTQQPLRGRSKFGGQRLGEMEVWALEGYGAAFTLLEMLTIKSDDIMGRMTLWSNIILHNPIYIGTPESFKVLICELQALCLDIGLFKISDVSDKKYASTFTSIDHLIKLP